jgi:hypothetical protein
MDLSINIHPALMAVLVTAFLALRIVRIERLNARKRKDNPVEVS